MPIVRVSASCRYDIDVEAESCVIANDIGYVPNAILSDIAEVEQIDLTLCYIKIDLNLTDVNNHSIIAGRTNKCFYSAH